MLNNQIKALISLLSEKNSKNLTVIKNRLIELKPDSLPFLQDALTHENPKIQNEVSSILEEVRLQHLTRLWIAFASCKDELDLEEGSFLYSSYAFPRLEVQVYRRTLNQWADELKTLLKSNRPTVKPFQAVLDFFFHTLGFTGNKENYHDPQNSYLPAVIDTKRGLPITLSVIFLLITNRLNLPFFPIGMPGHFIVKYQAERENFYIDPFNGGKILTRQDCIDFLTQAGYGYRVEYLQTTGHRAILERMLRNLAAEYSRDNQSSAVSYISKLIEILHRP